MNRKLKESKEKAKSLMSSGMTSMLASSSLSAMSSSSSSSQGLQLLAIKKIEDAIDTKSLNKLYWKSIVAIFFIEIGILFSLYLIIVVILYIIILDKISVLRLMKDYTQLNYEVSNNIYVSMGLTQLMSLTNQTEENLFDYFDSTSDTNNYHFVRNKVETTLTELMQLSTLEK